MHNLIEYSSNYSETTGSLWFYSKDKATDKSFKYNANLLRNTEADNANGILKYATIATPLKHLRKFWKSLEIPLIN